MFISDALLREYLNESHGVLDEDVKAPVNMLMRNLPMSKEKLADIKEASTKDEELCALKKWFSIDGL